MQVPPVMLKANAPQLMILKATRPCLIAYTGKGDTDIQSKQVMFPKVQQTIVELFLDQLQVDVIGKIIIMIGRKWDVSSVTGRYLSMDFVVSDAKLKNFTMKPNKEEYQILKNNTIMVKFDGATTIRKAFVKSEGFVRYMLELDVADDTRHVVVVLFDELATALVKCSTESITEPDDEVTLQDLCNAQKPFSIYFLGQISDDAASLLPKIDPTEGVEESMGLSTLDVDAGSHTPKVDADSEARGDTREADSKGKAARDSEKGRNKRIQMWKKSMVQLRGVAKTRLASIRIRINGRGALAFLCSLHTYIGSYTDVFLVVSYAFRYSFSLEVEDSAVEESHGSAQGSSKDNVGIHSDKKKRKR
ncbi:hypothetical protein Tco_0093784 [Tanacetum coccineum]